MLAGPAAGRAAHAAAGQAYASLDLPGQARLADDISACGRRVLVSTHVLGPVRDYPA